MYMKSERDTGNEEIYLTFKRWKATSERERRGRGAEREKERERERKG